jgi:hypothetical protein
MPRPQPDHNAGPAGRWRGPGLTPALEGQRSERPLRRDMSSGRSGRGLMLGDAEPPALHPEAPTHDRSEAEDRARAEEGDLRPEAGSPQGGAPRALGHLHRQAAGDPVLRPDDVHGHPVAVLGPGPHRHRRRRRGGLVVHHHHPDHPGGGLAGGRHRHPQVVPHRLHRLPRDPRRGDRQHASVGGHPLRPDGHGHRRGHDGPGDDRGGQEVHQRQAALHGLRWLLRADERGLPDLGAHLRQAAPLHGRVRQHGRPPAGRSVRPSSSPG